MKKRANNIIEIFMNLTVRELLDKKVKEAFDINPLSLDFRMLYECVSYAERDFWYSMFNNPDVLATPVLEKFEGCGGEVFLVISKSYITESSNEIVLRGLRIDCGDVGYITYSTLIETNGYWKKYDLKNKNKTISDYLYLVDDWYLTSDEEV